MNLDIKNKRILYELMTNARFSFKNIAERVGLSANAVKARVDGMIHDKIIEIFCQTIIRSHVGLDIEFNILIKLKNITVENKREAIEKLSKIERILHIMELQGRWDFSLSIVCINVFELRKYIDIIKQILTEHLYEMDVLIINKHRFLQKYYFLEGLNIKSTKVYKNDSSFQLELLNRKYYRGLVKLDDLDLHIIEIIKNNCRLSFEEIGKLLNKEPQSIKYRMRRMVQLNVLAESIPVINYSKIGYEKYILLLELKGNVERKKQLFTFMKNVPYAYEYMTSINSWDIIITLHVKKGSNTFERFNTELIDKFGDVLLNCEVLHVTQEHKYEFIPGNFIKFYTQELKENLNKRDFDEFTEKFPSLKII